MKAYPEYKASGIDWLETFPSHWTQCKLKHCVTMVLGKMLQSTQPSDGDYTLEKYLKSRNVSMLTLSDIKNLDSMWFSSSEKDIYRLQEGDIVMNEGGDIGRVAKWVPQNFDCYIQNSVHKLTPVEGVNSTFLTYYIAMVSFSGYFSSVVSQISIAHLTKEKLANTPVSLPPYTEQETIAAYLDDKTAKIDALVAEKYTQVEDLRKYRTSLITETVTHGLNPEVAFRPSSINWIGNIPENWGLSKFKFSLREIKDGTHFSPDTTTDGFPYVTATDVRGIGINYESTKKVSLDDFTKLVQSGCEIYKDDVLLVKDGATTGRVGMKDDDTPAVTLSSVAMLRTKADSLPKFLFYFLQSSIIQNQISIAMAGAAMPRITLEKLGNFIALIPPLDEQRQIAEYLDEKTAKIDALIDELTQQLDELALYRKTVISEAVTGKVDVRDWKPED